MKKTTGLGLSAAIVHAISTPMSSLMNVEGGFGYDGSSNIELSGYSALASLRNFDSKITSPVINNIANMSAMQIINCFFSSLNFVFDGLGSSSYSIIFQSGTPSSS